MYKSTHNQNMFRTALCSSVKYNCLCQHGDRCRYAHSIEELNRKPCRRGFHCTSLDCERSHPDESLELFQIRLRKALKPPEPVTIAPVIPEMKLLQKLMDEGRGMGLHENGIAEPIDVTETNIRRPGNTQGLGVSGKVHGRNNNFKDFHSTGFTQATTEKIITVSSQDDFMTVLELAFRLGDNITLTMA